MRNETKNSEKRNYRITIIVKDEIMIERFENEHMAMDCIKSIKELFPNLFVAGALEEKTKGWKVIWTLGCN